jgi:hypothetical protein
MSYPVRYFYYTKGTSDVPGKRLGPFIIPSQTGIGNASNSSAQDAAQLINDRMPPTMKRLYIAKIANTGLLHLFSFQTPILK